VRFKIKIFKILLIILFILSLNLNADAFEPKNTILSAAELRAGDSGYLLTVIKGDAPEKIPVKILSSVGQKSLEVNSYILIKILKGEIARGMSGSPVYVRRNKREFLIGAVSLGWDFADHTIAAVTPIDDMIKNLGRKLSAGVDANFLNNKNFAGEKILNKNCAGLSENFLNNNRDCLNLNLLNKNFAGLSVDKNLNKNFVNVINISGLSKGAALKLGESLGVNVNLLNNFNNINKNNNLEIREYNFKPGDAVSALLAWGDVEIAATGTVTEVDLNNKNFLAFGHEFLKRGAVNYPAAKAFIHNIIPSVSFPFKISSPEFIAGNITQDREAGIAGVSGYFVKSVTAELNFKNLDTGEVIKKYFRVVYDDFLTGKILEQAFNGLLEEAWGRKGQGTMSVNLIVNANGINNGWARKDIFYDENNIEASALKQPNKILNLILTQPYNKTLMPLGIRLDVEATQSAKALLIEDIEAPESVKAGSEFKVKIKLRPWRGDAVTREFKLKMPKNAAEGSVCELIVRGGGVQSSQQLAIEGGWLSLKSFNNMLNEINALDANNELIVELNADKLGEELNKIIKNKNIKAKNNKNLLLQEEREYLSETKARRIKEGNLKIFKSEYFIDGLMRRVISVE